MTRVGAMKEKDFDSIVPDISVIDMLEPEKKECLDLALQSYSKTFTHSELSLEGGENKYYKDMAEFIKRNLDEKLGGAWHVIVGRE